MREYSLPFRLGKLVHCGRADSTGCILSKNNVVSQRGLSLERATVIGLLPADVVAATFFHPHLTGLTMRFEKVAIRARYPMDRVSPLGP
jgi:hypothetical protein